METTRKTIRFKSRCGLTATWRLYKHKDGYGVLSIGNFKSGRTPVPSAFAPFEILDAVYGKRRFASMEECEAFARSR